VSTCARCGSDECRWHDYLQQVDHEQSNRDAFNVCTIDCRDRELANLRSLLRVATLQLERALTLLDDLGEPCSIRGDLESLLEKLS
jgi:hypothetical protein